MKGLDRKQRFDMNKNGLEISSKAIEKETEAQAEGQPHKPLFSHQEVGGSELFLPFYRLRRFL